MSYFKKGTPEFHLKKLKRLRDWLALSPQNLQLVKDGHDAVAWAIEQLEEKENGKTDN